MSPTVQTLPPGWRIEARSPKSRGFEDCAIRITSPTGEVVEYLARPYQVECDVTRQLEQALSAQSAPTTAVA
ncbi:hypothetical protein [Lysobacter arvi]|uniref:Uncharacterized protein n=1 Tax=Lysobacter arvi TaxID=3038776 RepID=A0ABU1CCD9_9GAMM|nr:hypothetical protein [Lysobacter arvi]MDR0182079.1 hypothetical protein [Lysobacter arvi]